MMYILTEQKEEMTIAIVTPTHLHHAEFRLAIGHQATTS
jgi:hypothetical protein